MRPICAERRGHDTDISPSRSRCQAPAHWLAAAAADPLAGDGVGRALRGGVLAAATALEAHGAKAGDAHAHYARRIALAHATHLQTCASFYSVSRCAENFVTQIEKMRYHGRVLEAFALRFERSLALNAEPDAPILAEMAS